MNKWHRIKIFYVWLKKDKCIIVIGNLIVWQSCKKKKIKISDALVNKIWKF